MRSRRVIAMCVVLVGDLAGCGPVQTDFDYPLTGDYELVRSSAHNVMIVPKGGWSDHTPIIRSKVVEFALDREFILAKRQHLKVRDSSANDTYKEPVEGVFDYWILDTRGPTAHGPLDEEEFKVKRQELGVSDQLRMQDVNSVSPYRY